MSRNVNPTPVLTTKSFSFEWVRRGGWLWGEGGGLTSQETTVQLSRKHVTHDLSSATDSHATNDRTTQRKEGSDAVQHEDSKHTALGYCYFVAVIHWKLNCKNGRIRLISYFNTFTIAYRVWCILFFNNSTGHKRSRNVRRHTSSSKCCLL